MITTRLTHLRHINHVSVSSRITLNPVTALPVHDEALVVQRGREVQAHGDGRAAGGFALVGWKLGLGG